MVPGKPAEAESSADSDSFSYENGPLSHVDLVRNAAYRSSQDWVVFSSHKNYVRPVRSYEYYHGEPCRLRSRASGKGPEIPPGAVYRYDHSMGHPATSWDPFLFPNPSRHFFASLRQDKNIFVTTKTDKTDALRKNKIQSSSPLESYIAPKHISSNRYGNLRDSLQHHWQYSRREAMSDANSLFANDPEGYEDLKRQLWLDPELRIECPFRLYADSKYCTKGRRIRDMSQLMRPGW